MKEMNEEIEEKRKQIEEHKEKKEENKEKKNCREKEEKNEGNLEKNEFKNINLKMEPYGKGDYRLLRYLPDGSCVFEEIPSEENKNNLHQYAQVFCSAMEKINQIKSKDENMKNNKEWNKGEEYRILVENELKELMVLFDMILGTLNYDKGRKYLSLNKCYYYKDSKENIQDLCISVTSRKQLLEKLRNLCKNVKLEINSINGIITQKYYLCFISQLIKYWKIMNKKYEEIDYMQLDSNFPYVTQISVEFYFLPSVFWKLSPNPIFLSWPPHPSFSPFKSQYAHITFSLSNLEKDEDIKHYEEISKKTEENTFHYKPEEIKVEHNIVTNINKDNLNEDNVKLKNIHDETKNVDDLIIKEFPNFNKKNYNYNDTYNTYNNDIHVDKVIPKGVNGVPNYDEKEKYVFSLETEHNTITNNSNNINDNENKLSNQNVENNIKNNKTNNYDDTKNDENKELNKSSYIEDKNNYSYYGLKIKEEEMRMFRLLDNTSIISVQFEGIAAYLIENNYFIQFDLFPLNVKLKENMKSTKNKKWKHIFPKKIIPKNLIFEQAKKVHEKLTRAQWVLIDKSIFCILAEQANNLKDKNNELVINLDNVSDINKIIKIHCTQINHKSIEFLLDDILIPSSSNKFISVDFSFVILYEPIKIYDSNGKCNNNSNIEFNTNGNTNYFSNSNNDSIKFNVNNNEHDEKSGYTMFTPARFNELNKDNRDNNMKKKITNDLDENYEITLDYELIQMFLNLALSKVRDLFICSWKYFSFEIPFYSADIHPMVYQNMFPDYRSDTLITNFFTWFIKSMNTYLRINEKKGIQ
ncbi:conserved Plasmodium protein, unknown function [Plasmodium gallinaceum]|uniref:Uncharacterized protein n=1 Tax=Plasmodium gallinaceum TaxID=5849 RepID=A0A1J1GKX8_PLAGA|nr:conserved Plasmodium protein, unknown function [Plasmodium gallinaceum]CRG92972.1 conserved Plasmodium protein, unknown function [Plasmodium gallinaceum]